MYQRITFWDWYYNYALGRVLFGLWTPYFLSMKLTRKQMRGEISECQFNEAIKFLKAATEGRG